MGNNINNPEKDPLHNIEHVKDFNELEEILKWLLEKLEEILQEHATQVASLDKLLPKNYSLQDLEIESLLEQSKETVKANMLFKEIGTGFAVFIKEDLYKKIFYELDRIDRTFQNFITQWNQDKVEITDEINVDAYKALIPLLENNFRQTENIKKQLTILKEQWQISTLQYARLLHEVIKRLYEKDPRDTYIPEKRNELKSLVQEIKPIIEVEVTDRPTKATGLRLPGLRKKEPQKLSTNAKEQKEQIDRVFNTKLTEYRRQELLDQGGKN